MNYIVHIIDYLYNRNINNIIYDEEYNIKNSPFLSINKSLTNKELYYFHLLNDYVETLFNNIKEDNNISLSKSNNYTNGCLRISGINILLDNIKKFNIYFNINNAIKNITNMFMIDNILYEYKFIFAFIYLNNFIKYFASNSRPKLTSGKYFQNIDILIINDIINMCTFVYENTTIDYILNNVQSCTIPKNYKIYSNDYIMRFNNYNKLITKAFLFNTDINDIFVDLNILKDNITAHILMNKNFTKNHNSLDFIDDDIRRLSENNILVPYVIPIYFITLFDDFKKFKDSTYLDLLIGTIIEKQRDYIKDYDPVLFIKKLFDEIIFYRKFVISKSNNYDFI